MPISMLNSENFVRRNILEKELLVNETSTNINSRELLLDEARNRGWEELNLSPNLTLFSENGIPKGGLLYHMPSSVGRVGDEICKNKALEKKLYEHWGIPTPKSRTYSADEYQEALDFLSSMNAPMVVKPARGSMGSGISVGVETAEEFSVAWSLATKTHGEKAKVIVEEFLERIDTRVLVIAGQFVAASTRIPPFVVGNGRSPFGELLQELKSSRSRNAYLKRHPVRLDGAWIADNGIDDATVLDKEKIFFLNLTSNASRGGITINTSEIIDHGLKTLAESVARAVPNAPILGVDVFSKSLEHAEGAVILETNSTPQIGVHHDVTFGKPFDAARLIFDHMEATL